MPPPAQGSSTRLSATACCRKSAPNSFAAPWREKNLKKVFADAKDEKFIYSYEEET